MGVADLTPDAAMVGAAPFRSGRVPLERCAHGPALPFETRDPRASGRKVDHVHTHGAGAGDDLVGHGPGRDDRSLFADTRTLVKIMTHPRVGAALGRLDSAPDETGRQKWLHEIPVMGACRARGRGDHRRRIAAVSIDTRSHGDALFISSCHPDPFQLGPSPAWA